MCMASAAAPGMQIHLRGGLGVGKTTLVRGFLRGYGYQGKVKSPSYTLVEPYSLNNISIYHFDLYRINKAEEVESFGYREYPGEDTICLVEWPEKGGSYLGEPDLMVHINQLPEGRSVEITSFNSSGNSLINKISAEFPGN